MHSLFEEYLLQIEMHLSAMPVKQRNEELREMQAHLLDAVLIHREIGEPEAEAVQTAIEQFGLPENVGRDTVAAWRRERTLNAKSLLGAAFTTTLTVCLLFFLMNQYIGLIMFILPRTWLLYLGKHPGYGMDFTQMTFVITFGLAGLAAGSLFPRRAVAGACLGLALFWAGFAVVGGAGQLQALISVDGLTHQGRGGWIAAAVSSAWAGSRWRLAKAVRLVRS